MGKTKQIKEKRFDRNVEISAPILDPELIKQIHSPPSEQRVDIKNSGFKALLSDLNSQDSTDEVTPIMETNYLPSYIGISCAVSGYSSYSAYNKRPPDDYSDSKIEPSMHTKLNSSNRHTRMLSTPTRSQTSSPTQVNHITIDKSSINSPDQERKELTEKLTASASERRRSPSPLPPVEDERHHGAYVGARYCPLPAPSKLVHKHIPLLGIDDDQDPDEYVADDVNKVEEKIATLYGDNFVEDWKESMSHKSKRENPEAAESTVKSPKDLVSLKPPASAIPDQEQQGNTNIEIPTPSAKVLANVEKEFLTKLLTDENPPMPKPPSPLPSSPKLNEEKAHEQQPAKVSMEVTEDLRENLRNDGIQSAGVETPDSPIQDDRSLTPPTPIDRRSPDSPDSQNPVEAEVGPHTVSEEPIVTTDPVSNGHLSPISQNYEEEEARSEPQDFSIDQI